MTRVWLTLVAVVAVVGVSRGQVLPESATVIRASARATTTAFGDEAIVTDVVAEDTAGQRYTWTAPGGQLADGSGMGVSGRPLFFVGDRVLFQGGRVFGGHDAFTVIGVSWPTATVGYYINGFSTQLAESALVAAVANSTAPWNAVGAAIALQYLGPTGVAVVGRDGINAVFTRRDETVAWTGETRYWWDTAGHMTDADVVLNERYAWFVAHDPACTGFYVENTMVHEFGHVLGIAHSTVDEATMWPFTTTCETVRETLAADDVAALVSIYPVGGGGEEPPPPDPDPTPDPKPCRKRGRWAC